MEPVVALLREMALWCEGTDRHDRKLFFFWHHFAHDLIRIQNLDRELCSKLDCPKDKPRNICEKNQKGFFHWICWSWSREKIWNSFPNYSERPGRPGCFFPSCRKLSGPLSLSRRCWQVVEIVWRWGREHYFYGPVLFLDWYTSLQGSIWIVNPQHRFL